MRRAEGRLVPQVVAYAHERYGYDLVTAAWWAGRACEPPDMSPVRREAAFTPRIVCRLFPGGLHPAWRLLGIVHRPGDAPYHEPRLYHEARLGSRRRRRSARAAEAEERLYEASRCLPLPHGDHVGPAGRPPREGRGRGLAAPARHPAPARPP